MSNMGPMGGKSAEEMKVSKPSQWVEKEEHHAFFVVNLQPMH